METELGKKGAFVDAIYVCPHHTDKGFEGEHLNISVTVIVGNQAGTIFTGS